VTGLSFEFVVNNVRMFTKGSNWIPADVLTERVTPEYLRDLLESVKVTHQNMMRIWGGGIYESDEFYEVNNNTSISIIMDETPSDVSRAT
jgi:beta-mannosidase